MNFVDCHVIELIGEPYFKYDVWWQRVKFIAEGVIGQTDLFRKEKQQLKEINIDYKFLS